MKMRLWLVCWMGASLGVVSELHAESEPAASHADRVLARVQFVGTTEWFQQAGNDLQTIASLPATTVFRDELFLKLGRWIQDSMASHAKEPKGDQAVEWFRSLMVPWLQSETYLELRQEPDGPWEWNLAIHLPDPEADEWQITLKQLLQAWTGGKATPVRSRQASGWELQCAESPHWIRCLRSGPWLLATLGAEPLTTQTSWLDRLKSDSRPVPPLEENALDVEIQRDLLQNHLAASRDVPWPEIRLEMRHTDNRVRTKVQLTFERSIEWKADPWMIPTNLLREPLVSFTAAQGLDTWWPRLFPNNRKITDQLPDQLYHWTQTQLGFQTFVAGPTDNATNRLEQLAGQYLPALNCFLETHRLGNVQWKENRAYLFWKGLPIVEPYLQPVANVPTQFLQLGLLPPVTGDEPAPDPLLNQVRGRDRLLYYDWEITDARLALWRQLFPLVMVVFPDAQLTFKDPGQSWLKAIASHLGNSVTELTWSSPTELVLTRNSHLGFNAAELIALATWLDTDPFAPDAPAQVQDAPPQSPGPKSLPTSK